MDDSIDTTDIEIVLEFLVEEHLKSSRHHRNSHLRDHIHGSDYWDQLWQLKRLLCVRPAIPKLPNHMHTLVDKILSQHRNHRLMTSSHSIDSCYQLGSSDTQQKTPIFSIWQGDITNLSDVTAIVNAANSQLLGCFRPEHRCIDNAIHAAAGPRLREACNDLMFSQGYEEPTGRAKVTPGFNLHAEYVIHTVGPQISSGERITQTDVAQLAKCYSSCLDAADTLPASANGQKVIVFCGISTGVFGFPANEASQIAINTVLEWCKAHPSTSITNVLFDVFSDEQFDLYNSIFQSLCRQHKLTLAPRQDMNLHVTLPETNTLLRQAANFLADSDYVLISAGAGLSAATGLDYTSQSLFSKHFPGFLKYGFQCLYHVFGFNEWPTPQARWSYLMTHLDTVRKWPTSPLYKSLLAFLNSRWSPNHIFIRTTNADNFFAKHSFPNHRISTPQGSYTFLQCAKPCRKDAIFASEPYIKAALPHIDPKTQHLSTTFPVPTCPFCAADLILCVRSGAQFNEDPFQNGEREYRAFVHRFLTDSKNQDKTLTVLELGVGMNTPSVLRWPDEELVEEAGGRIKLVRLRLGAAGCVDPALEGTGNAIGIEGELGVLLEQIIDEVELIRSKSC